jgi:hypothetical protein
MGDGEGLVEVEVRHIAPDLAGLHEAHQGVHVGPIQVDLPAVLVRDGADLAQRVLEDAVGRGVGDHAGGEAIPCRLGLGAEVVEVHVAVGRRARDHDLHARHLRRGGVWCREPRGG